MVDIRDNIILPCHRESADTGSSRKNACWIVMLAAAAACLTDIIFLAITDGNGLNIGPFRKGVSEQRTGCNVSRRNEQFGFLQSILFVHVPKAGGTTVQEVMEKWAAPLGIPYFNAHRREDKQRMPVKVSDAPAIYAGHDAFRLVTKKAESDERAKPLRIVTLRDPISRFISHFDFVLHNWKHRDYREVNRLFGNATLQQILEAQQIKYCGEIDPSPVDEGGNNKTDIIQKMMHSQLEFMCGDGCQGLWPEQKLEEALKNLEQCDCIAVTERMDDLVDQMRFHIDWIPSNISGFPHVNDARWNKSHVDEGMRSTLKECMKHDFILYERAVELARNRTAVARQCIPDRT